MQNNKYIVYTSEDKIEYDTFNQAAVGYASCNTTPKFLYQPDKTYFIATISSTGRKVGRDHAYHRDTAKCYGLFLANSKNSINKFLSQVKWSHGGVNDGSPARIYKGNYGSSCSSLDNWNDFERVLQNNYLKDHNINYFYMIDGSYGAVDIDDVNNYIKKNPYKLY